LDDNAGWRWCCALVRLQLPSLVASSSEPRMGPTEDAGDDRDVLAIRAE
jgi:hypothetical protein